MRLTRRDALLTTLGGVATTVASFWVADRAETIGNRGRDSLTDGDIETLVALAEIVYPSEVENPDAFVEGYVEELYIERRRGITRAIDDLNHEVKRIHGQEFAEFAPGRRDSILRGLGVQRTRPVVDGNVPERIRYFLVNGLLYALLTNPAGTELIGIDNPLGYPGGYESALRGSQ